MASILRDSLGDVKGKGSCGICCASATACGGIGCGVCDEDHHMGHLLPSEKEVLDFFKMMEDDAKVEG